MERIVKWLRRQIKYLPSDATKSIDAVYSDNKNKVIIISSNPDSRVHMDTYNIVIGKYPRDFKTYKIETSDIDEFMALFFPDHELNDDFKEVIDDKIFNSKIRHDGTRAFSRWTF